MARKSNEQVGNTTDKQIYIGPSLAGLKTNTTLIGGMSEKARQLIARDAKYRRLFVTSADFAKSQIELKTGALKDIYFNAAQERF